MNCFKASEGIYTLPFQPEPQKDKPIVDHYVLIDNLKLGRLTNIISSNYPRMLERYSNLVDLNSINLIKSFPKGSSKVVDQSSLYSEFKKMVRCVDSITDHGVTDHGVKQSSLETLLDHTSNIFDSGNHKELIIFTNINDVFSNETIERLNSISEANINVFIISINSCSDSIKSRLKATTISSQESNLDSETFYYNTVKNGFFLLKDLSMVPSASVKFDLESGSTLGNKSCDSIRLEKNSSLIVKTREGHLKLSVNYENRIEHFKFDLGSCQEETNNYHLISGINSLVENIETTDDDSKVLEFYESYPFLKGVCLDTIGDNSLSLEIRTKAQYVYNKLRGTTTKFKNIELNKLDSGTGNTDIAKQLLSYSKKSSVRMVNKKHQQIMAERVINNTRIIEDINNLVKEVDNPKMVEYFSKNDSNETEEFTKSCEFFNSILTLSSWYDEMKYGNPIGLLVNVSSSNLGKIGVGKNVNIKNITTTFYPVSDYIDMTLRYFKDHNRFGDLNGKDIIKGRAVGEGNTVIPLYICKDHWRFSKKFVPIMLGITFSHHPLCYSKSHYSFLFSLLLEMNLMTFDKCGSNLNERWIQAFFAYLRTCAEVSFDLKYSYGIRTLVSGYLSNPLKRISNGSMSIFSMLGQILCTGFILSNDDIQSLVKCIVEELIRSYYYNKNNDTSESDDVSTRLKKLENELIKEISILQGFIKCHRLLKILFANFGSYNKFIKFLERNYGMLPEKLAQEILGIIKKEIGLIEESTLSNLLASVGIEENYYELVLWILQGRIQSKNKERKMAIKKGDYVDSQIIKIGKELIQEKYKIDI